MTRPSPRWLVVDARIPTPDRDGGSLRLVRLVQMLVGRGVAVDFVPSFPVSFAPFDATLEADERRLVEMGVGLPDRGRRAGVAEHLARDGRRYGVVLVAGAYVASRHVCEVRSHAPGARLVFDTIDLHHLREYRGARLTRNAPRLRHALMVKRAELSTVREADATLVVSEREKRLLEREAAGARVFVVPNVHDVADAVPGPGARSGMLFLGAFTFDPNVDAIVHFVTDRLPRIRERVPGLELRVVGSDPPETVHALARPGVVVTGHVPDLRPEFDAARVFVAPLRYGAGIKGKLLTSLGLGLPVVASPIAAEGIPVGAGEHLLLADTDTEWAAAVAGLVHDDDLWRRLSRRGQQVVREHYGFDVVDRRLGDLLGWLASAGVPAGGSRPATATVDANRARGTS